MHVGTGRGSSLNSELGEDQEAAPCGVAFIPLIRCALIYEVIAGDPDQ